ncbi:hypothetical protein EM595_3095 [Duffyella gerundensis]|uniref:Uncharacterized protein n=1 Tax=Duffyella gerundensis TaxID=1619313 RepID=A0A0U5L4E6_9GAMM|nr:hypothetical protein EM595_3095 [Duffyella gerundensis]
MSTAVIDLDKRYGKTLADITEIAVQEMFKKTPQSYAKSAETEK